MTLRNNYYDPLRASQFEKADRYEDEDYEALRKLKPFVPSPETVEQLNKMNAQAFAWLNPMQSRRQAADEREQQIAATEAEKREGCES